VQCLIEEVRIVGVYDLVGQLGIGVVLLGRVAGYGGSGRAYVLETGRGLEAVESDEVLGIFGQEPEALLAATKLLCLFDLGDVRIEANDGHQIALLIVHGSVGDQGRKSSSILSLYHELPGPAPPVAKLAHDLFCLLRQLL
jgi:hypothetical protein